MDDKTALKSSHAGMRLIAQMTIFNTGDIGRLRAYIRDNYTADVLVHPSLEDRLQQFQDIQQRVGRMRVQQVMATSENRVVVLLGGEHDLGVYYSELKVEEDYPHKIIAYDMHPMEYPD